MPPIPDLQVGPPWQNGSPGFMQQGQVDWVAFGNTMWSASGTILQRFASSGIQPMTYGAGLAIAGQFRMSQNGSERIDQAMQSLRGFPGFDKILYFGFGYQSIVRLLGSNQQGLKCVALCSCLTEVHSEGLAARILEELWRLYDFPDTYEPSHTQLLALMKACSGVVTRSSFAKDVDAMTGHGRWMFGSEGGKISPLLASGARDVAKAMKGLFEITMGNAEAISLVGQNECAFIAAFGYWLFDLTTFVEDDTGRILFRSHEHLNREETQVLVTYTLKDHPSALQQRTTYILSIGTDLVSPRLSTSESRWILKVPWDGCLARTFGTTFRSLSELVTTLGCFLGGAARIYTGLALGESNVAYFSRRQFIDFTQFSYGQGLIHSVSSIFPELGRLKGLDAIMERGLKHSFDRALKEVEQSAQSLRGACHCNICSGKSSSDHPNNYWINRDCLFVLAMTLRNLVSVLACTGRDDTIPVTPFGLQALNKKNHRIYEDWADKNDFQTTLTAISVGLAMIDEPRGTRVSSPDAIIADIRPLFDGTVDNSKPLEFELVTAIASGGICCYRECLQAPSIEASAMRFIHVVPGNIERGSALYNIVQDGVATNKINEIDEPAKLAQADIGNRQIDSIRIGEFDIKALVSESSEYRVLEFFYKIQLPGGSVTSIQPASFSLEILDSSGVLSCDHNGQCKQTLAFSCSVVQSGWTVDNDSPGLDYHSGIALCFWPYEENIARCVAFANNMVHSTHLSLIRRSECLPCCSTAIIRENPAIHPLPEDQIVAHII